MSSVSNFIFLPLGDLLDRACIGLILVMSRHGESFVAVGGGGVCVMLLMPVCHCLTCSLLGCSLVLYSYQYPLIIHPAACCVTLSMTNGPY